MKKIFIFFSTLTMLYSATQEQVDRYLMISGSEDQLLQVEQMVDGLGRMFNDGTPIMNDTQMISVRFREYIQRNLSEDEMQEIMENYKHSVLRKLVSAQAIMDEADTMQEYMQFIKDIKSDPLPTNITSTVKEIAKKSYDDELLGGFFDKVFMRVTAGAGRMIGRHISKDELEKTKKSFIKRMRENNYQALLFMTRDFSIDELNELNDIAGSSSSDRENRVVMGGVVYAMEEMLESMERKFERMVRNRDQIVKKSTDPNNNAKPAATKIKNSKAATAQ